VFWRPQVVPAPLSRSLPGRKDLGYLNLANDDEAFYLAQNIVRETRDGARDQYAGAAMVITEGERQVDRIPLDSDELDGVSSVIGDSTVRTDAQP
jgi:hypothetical protein